MSRNAPVPWLGPEDPFPRVEEAWTTGSPAPGLLAAGGNLSAPRLVDAYRHGIFPWFSPGQAILWFSTDPRMVLRPTEFLLHHALRKTLRQLVRMNRLQIRFDDDFEQVMRLCAASPRSGQSGTWIGNDMIHAYGRLHRMGHARCVTAWVDGELAGGLYAVIMGRMVYGESMFTRRSSGSKMALGALVAWALEHQLPLIDCQQDTEHLRSLGAQTLSRPLFLSEMTPLTEMVTPPWAFSPIFWAHLGIHST
ncbi:MAG: leucyl/phenylalanyl-tRNA--protein transferase [Alphaproteobacteria bacterium]|nr:leucyl/phenylalanyl-tRNA--protein transferase [Alphaproteobacteria bacterium]